MAAKGVRGSIQMRPAALGIKTTPVMTAVDLMAMEVVATEVVATDIILRPPVSQ
jgi:hypothetical protein